MTKQENEERLARLKSIVLSMPEKPGSYQYYDENHTIIYVGKAKNLKRRVSSYFHKEVDRYKTKVLVSKIFDISYTVVNTEEDALLLENSLIKKYNPRYNVLLKDGKTYPSICVTNEYFPRIFKTSLNEYDKTEHMNELFSKMSRLIADEPEKYTEDEIRSALHSSFQEYLDSKSITLDEYETIMEKVIKEYAKEDISQEKINDLLDQLNGSRDGGSR